MTEKLLRLLRLIILIQGKPGILARELAERCETNIRTIYRDLELLATIVPITHLGHGKGYAYVGDFSMYPLDWTDQETMAFSMLSSLMDQIKPLLPAGFESAYEKVMAASYKEKRERAKVVEKVAGMIRMGTPAYREDASYYLIEIMQAILSERTIKTIYHTQSRNEQSERLIDPYFLVPREQRFYLIGYCHAASEVRTFRVSRFKHVKVLDRSFDKGDFNIKAYLSKTWSILRGNDNIHFKVRFSPNVARYVKEEELFVKPKLTEFEDGSLIFEVTLNDDMEFLGWLAQYGEEAEILEPVRYREEMKQKLERWLKLYS